LVIDLPPGTGDVQLSVIQTVPLAGAIVVTTPSDVSLEDGRKAVQMFRQVRVPILGLVENMSYLICPHCKERIDVFSTGGGRKTAQEMGEHFLAELALDPGVRSGGDSGNPIALRDSGDPSAAAYHAMAKETVRRVFEVTGASGPKIEISD
ncbi:MAG: P-loop NTPase, partial [Bryobacteraceae bacterium]